MYTASFSAISETRSACPGQSLSRTTIYRWKLEDRASDALSKSLQRHMWLEVVGKLVEIVSQNRVPKQSKKHSAEAVDRAWLLDHDRERLQLAKPLHVR